MITFCGERNLQKPTFPACEKSVYRDIARRITGHSGAVLALELLSRIEKKVAIATGAVIAGGWFIRAMKNHHWPEGQKRALRIRKRTCFNQSRSDPINKSRLMLNAASYFTFALQISAHRVVARIERIANRARQVPSEGNKPQATLSRPKRSLSRSTASINRRCRS